MEAPFRGRTMAQQRSHRYLNFGSAHDTGEHHVMDGNTRLEFPLHFGIGAAGSIWWKTSLLLQLYSGIYLF
jgi:hypothetical protein